MNLRAILVPTRAPVDQAQLARQAFPSSTHRLDVADGLPAHRSGRSKSECFRYARDRSPVVPMEASMRPFSHPWTYSISMVLFLFLLLPVGCVAWPLEGQLTPPHQDWTWVSCPTQWNPYAMCGPFWIGDNGPAPIPPWHITREESREQCDYELWLQKRTRRYR